MFVVFCLQMCHLAVTQLQLTLFAVAVTLAAVAIGVVLYVLNARKMRVLNNSAQWEELLERVVARLPPVAHDEPLVSFRFHTYGGTWFDGVQIEHAPELPRAIALEYLRELHRYNLRNCFPLHQYSLAVPFLSYGNYWVQRRRLLALRPHDGA